MCDLKEETKKKLKKIGTGGFSKIYEDNHNGIRCAIKFADKNNTRSSLRKEVKILEHLKDCKHVVKILDYKISRKGFIKYELLKEDLYAYMDKKKTYKHRKNIIVQLKKAIIELHKKGIMHCDIKPNNIMVDNKGVLKLIDFGHALFFDEINNDNICIGTVPYRSPEYILGAKISHTSDYWSMGCVILEMFSCDTIFKPIKENKITRHGYMLGLILILFGNINPKIIDKGFYKDLYFVYDGIERNEYVYRYEYLIEKKKLLDSFFIDFCTSEAEYNFYYDNLVDFFYKDLLNDKNVNRFIDPPAKRRRISIF